MQPALSAEAANLLRISARLEPVVRPYAGVGGGSESDLRRELVRALEVHPAWPWLREIRAIPRLVSAQLLARLDPEVPRSSSPAAFWSVCGLHRELPVRFECPVCELGIASNTARGVQLWHHDPRTGLRCPVPFAIARRMRGTEGEPPRRLPYNTVARAASAELGHRISSRQGGYRSFFRATRAGLRCDPNRGGYARMELEKLFLEHLWTIWRARLGLPGAPCSAAPPEFRDPWSVTARKAPT